MKAKPTTIIHCIELIGKNLSFVGLLYDKNQSVIEKSRSGKKRITWAVEGTRPDLLTDSNANIREYVELLKGRHYQFLLIDGSFIQFSYEVDSRNNIISSRLVWYPCPVEFVLEELEYATIDEIVLTTPLEKVLCKPPLRLDFAPHQIKENHSSTHLHLGMESFRLPVYRAMEPSRFLRLIIRTIYPDIWGSTAIFKDVDDWAASDKLSDEDKLMGFLSWQAPITLV